jgi:hypothetical protein
LAKKKLLCFLVLNKKKIGRGEIEKKETEWKGVREREDERQNMRDE